MPPRTPSTLAVGLGFLAIYVIWGSTYLAIRFGVETLPPFLMAAVRFVAPGAAMYAWLRFRGTSAPSATQWRNTAIVGTLLLLGGNGIVTWAEQWVPSGLTALLIASVPLWMGLLNWVLEPATRPGPRAISGILLGFVGVGVLVNPAGELGADRSLFLGSAMIVVASALWAAGSLTSRRVDLPASPFLSTAMQMITGSAALALVGTATGEWGRIDLAAVSTKSLLSLLYLMTFGSVVALSAYVWLLKVSTPSKVSTYAFVNPVVAVFLGWLLAGETLSPQTFVAATVIVASVVLITTEGMKRTPRSLGARRRAEPVPECSPEKALATD